MKNFVNFIGALIALCFCCGVGRAQNLEAWQKLQPAMSKMLDRAATRMEKVESEEAETARHALILAMAQSGNYPAARKLVERLTTPGYIIDAWLNIGKMQGLIAKDRAAATADFEKAVAAAQRLKANSSNQRSAYVNIAEARARSGDMRGAIEFAQGLDEQARSDALLRMARFAAWRGNEEPALAFSQVALGENDRSEAHSLRALALATRDGDTPAARSALTKVTIPLHKVPVLLALFDHPVGGARGDARLLDAALAAVAQNQPIPGAFGFHDMQNDAALGAIALRQLQTGADRAAGIKQALATLENIKSPDSARKPMEQIGEKLAVWDLDAALSLVEKFKAQPRVYILSAIARGLGRNLPSLPEEKRQQQIKTIEKVINQALEMANSLDEDDRRWAGVPVARALAEANEFSVAYQVINRIDSANVRANAFAGIARSAIENQYDGQAQDALKNMETATLTETQPEVAVQILAQTAQEITKPLLGEQEVDIASSMAGLE